MTNTATLNEFLNKKETKMTFENLNQKGVRITCESSTTDYGYSNYPQGWWGARVYNRVKYSKEEFVTNVPAQTFAKIVREAKFKIIEGGFDRKVNLMSTITVIEIC